MTKLSLNDGRDANKCRHFNGGMNKKCDAGIAYDEINRRATEGDSGCMLRLPCRRAMEAEYPCPSLSRMTDEELAQEKKEQDAAVERFLNGMRIVRPLIIADIGPERMKQSVSGTIPCPICKTGTVHYSRAGSYNGHVHAACSTEGCIRWME
jgi:hypothetical protein